MKVLNARVMEIIRELVELGITDFNYYPKRDGYSGLVDRVDVTFQDDNEQKVSVEVRLKEVLE